MSLSAPFELLAPEKLLTPPIAPRITHQEIRHGETVDDDYFWLREKSNPAVTNYLEAENAYTAAATKNLQPFAHKLYGEMLGRIKQTDLSVPVRRGDYWHYTRTVEGQQYPIHCRRKISDGERGRGSSRRERTC